MLFLYSCKANTNINTKNSLYYETNEYEEKIQDFQEVSAKTLSDEVKKPMFICFGRFMYPYCREFVPKLNVEIDISLDDISSETARFAKNIDNIFILISNSGSTYQYDLKINK